MIPLFNLCPLLLISWISIYLVFSDIMKTCTHDFSFFFFKNMFTFDGKFLYKCLQTVLCLPKFTLSLCWYIFLVIQDEWVQYFISKLNDLVASVLLKNVTLIYFIPHIFSFLTHHLKINLPWDNSLTPNQMPSWGGLGYNIFGKLL